ncbi:hypothetical protein FOZ62_000811, partial [Perkinsus olseni]
MILDDGCALAVELHYHLTGEGSGSVPVCVGWCLLLPPQLDPLTECIVSNQAHDGVLLRSRLMKGPGETLAGRRVWAGSPTGTGFSIELAMTGEAYASWLGERQKVLHAERLKEAPLRTAKPLPAVRSPREAPAVTQTPRALLPPVPSDPYQEPMKDMVVEGPELPAPAMLFETRSFEAPPLTPSEVPNGTPPSPPRAVDPPYALPVEPPRTPPVEPLPVPAIEKPGPLVAEPLHVSDVQQPSIPNLGEKLEAVVAAVPPTAPVALPSGGEAKAERNAPSPSLRDANTQYDVSITEATEHELIPVKASASVGAANPLAGFAVSTQAGRQSDPPPPRDMSPADKASAVVAGLMTASTAEQENLAALDWQLEENDHLAKDEITMAIVGWRPREGARRPGSKKVYFSAKFYTFPPQTTDAAELPYTACHTALSSSRTGQRVAGRDGHDIELEMHCAETGMLVATASVPLRGIARQQRMVSRSEREVPCCGVGHAQGAPSVLGWLQVVIENCGSRECGQLGHSHPDLVPSPAGGYALRREDGKHTRAGLGRKNTRVKARRLPWPDTAPYATHDAVKYFADQREKSRLQLVQRRMRESLMERRYLPAVAGEANYFTVPFTNPSPAETLYSVQLGRVGTQGSVTVAGAGHCGLFLVTDPTEWRYLVASRGFAEPDCGYELFTATSEFLLR